MFFNSISRKLLENFLWCMSTDQYHLLTDMEIGFRKGKFTPEGETIKKKVNNCKVRSPYLQDYGKFFTDDERNNLVKKIVKAKKTENDRSEYDLRLEQVIPTFARWLKEQEALGVPADVVTKNAHGEVVEKKETPAPDFSSANNPHPDDVAKQETFPATTTTTSVTTDDDLPF